MRSRFNILRTCTRPGALCGLLAAGTLLAGCHTAPPLGDPKGGAAPAPATSQAGAPNTSIGPEILRVGDVVKVTFLDTTVRIEPIEALIKEDGSIPLILEKSVHAAGKTTGQLEKEIHDIYVTDYFKRATIQVQDLSHRFTIKGDVRSPNTYAYPGALTVLKAIATAGDFTEFARRAYVQVVRANGRIEIENCLKAMRDPRFDLPVYPGDLINVPRRYWPWQK